MVNFTHRHQSVTETIPQDDNDKTITNEKLHSISAEFISEEINRNHSALIMTNYLSR